MEKDTTSWINVPNVLTFLRILMIPVFIIAYYALPEDRWVSVAVFALASATDALDGYLARKWNQITSFGKLCDPLADKLMVLSILFCLAYDGCLAPAGAEALNWIIVLTMIAKELFMMCGSMYMLYRGIVVCANIWGKIATVSFIAGIILVFPWHENRAMTLLGQVIVYVAVLCSLTAMVSYIISSVKTLREAKIR